MTTTIPNSARGTLYEVFAPTATRPAGISFHLPGSQYQLHLRTDGTPTPPSQVGKRIVGTIHAQARRVDRTTKGGRFVEPLIGRPRRVQGVVISTDSAANTITLDCGGSAAVDGLPLPIVCKLTDARQKADDFAVGALVGADILDGATFTR